MARWVVQWAYSSSLGGPWQAGEAVELDAETAAHVNRTSPGVLVAADGPKAGPPADRMVRKAKARSGEPAAADPRLIDKTTCRAVRD